MSLIILMFLVRDNKKLLNNELLSRINLDRAGKLRFDDEDIFAMSFKTGTINQKLMRKQYIMLLKIVQML